MKMSKQMERGFPHRKHDAEDSKAEADRFADAILPVQLDAIGELLIRSALHAEHIGATHPLDAVAAMSRFPGEYNAACQRVFDACGLDHQDLSREEIIDTLVAAAYWEVP